MITHDAMSFRPPRDLSRYIIIQSVVETGGQCDKVRPTKYREIRRLELENISYEKTD